MKILNKFSLDEATQLVVDGYRGVSSNDKYTAKERIEGSRELLKELSKDYRNNKEQIFAIIERGIETILPEKIMASIERFADIENFAEGDTPRFAVRNGKITAYTVALGSGVKRQRKDKKTIVVETEATQVKIYEELPRLRAGLVDFNELMDDALEALEDEFYAKIYKTLTGTYANLPAKNKVTAATVVESDLDKLIQITASYGQPVIMGTRRGLSTLPTLDSSLAKDDIYKNGLLGTYKGAPVVEIKNTTTDESNESFVLEDRYIYIIPEGKEKIVKVAIEGQPYVRDTDGADWTVNFETMIQTGVAVLQNNFFTIYDNSSLA